MCEDGIPCLLYVTLFTGHISDVYGSDPKEPFITKVHAMIFVFSHDNYFY